MKLSSKGIYTQVTRVHYTGWSALITSDVTSSSHPVHMVTSHSSVPPGPRGSAGAQSQLIVSGGQSPVDSGGCSGQVWPRREAGGTGHRGSEAGRPVRRPRVLVLRPGSHEALISFSSDTVRSGHTGHGHSEARAANNGIISSE